LQNSVGRVRRGGDDSALNHYGILPLLILLSPAPHQQQFPVGKKLSDIYTDVF